MGRRAKDGSRGRTRGKHGDCTDLHIIVPELVDENSDGIEGLIARVCCGRGHFRSSSSRVSDVRMRAECVCEQ